MPLLPHQYKSGDLLRRTGGRDGDPYGIRHPPTAYQLQEQVLPEELLGTMSSGKDAECEV